MVRNAQERCIYLGLPAFNEELAIAPLFDRVREAQKTLISSDNSSGLKVLVYDDGSTDNTAEQVRTHSYDLDVYLLSPQENGGLGVALRALFTQFLSQAQEQDLLVVMDTDDTHDPSQISELLHKLDQDSLDVVIASRYRKGSKTMGVPAYRQILSFGFAGLVKVMLPIKGVLDYSCGYRIYTYGALSQILTESGFPLQESGFASMPEVLVRLRQKSLHFGEIPLRLSYDRRLTVSKMRAWENSRRLLSQTINWRLRPSSLESKQFAGPSSLSWWVVSSVKDGKHPDVHLKEIG